MASAPKTLKIDDFPQDLKDWLNNRTIEEVECVIPDVVGFARGKAMPIKKFLKTERMYLSPALFFQTVSGQYAEVEFENAWTENDMMMLPDVKTARAVPWTSDITVQVICDLFRQNGDPVGFAPRNVLKRVLKLYEDEGWKPVVAPTRSQGLTNSARWSTTSMISPKPKA